MPKVGLSQEEIVAILGEGIVKGQPIDSDALINAITKAIIRNNEAIERQIPEVVNSKVVNDLRGRGMRF